MPNHCSNEMIVEGDFNRVKHFYHANQGVVVSHKNKKGDEVTDYKELSFDCAVPVPKRKRMDCSLSGGWYDFGVDNWGTKWDAYDVCVEYDEEENHLFYDSTTAWSPPVKWMEKASRKFRVKLKCNWHEEGGEAGEIVFDNGKLLLNVDTEHPYSNQFDEEE